jgi:lysophospholipase L1-like esterase
MKARFALVFFCSFFVTNSFCQKVYPISKETEQILFLGNSITYSGQYIAFVETYYRLKHPYSSIEWLNLGLPSETVSGLSEDGHAGGAFPRPDLHERIDRVFDQIQPDIVFANYGMNDGIYLPLDNDRFNSYKDGIEWLNEKIHVVKADAVFLTPPIYDPMKGEAYANVLDNYSDWLISKKYTDSWKVLDLHWPMRKYLEKKREIEPEFYLAKDGVHPGEIGHWLMAKQILTFLGENPGEYETFESVIQKYKNGQEILSLIFKKQVILRDAWLRSTGHLRPGLAEGLSHVEAKIQIEAIEKQVQTLLK